MKVYDEMKVVKDFTTPKYLEELAKANLVIFHGADDLNVGYADIKPVHDRLLELNPDIKLHIAEGVGHQLLPEWREEILRFLEEVSKQET